MIIFSPSPSPPSNSILTSVSIWLWSVPLLPLHPSSSSLFFVETHGGQFVLSTYSWEWGLSWSGVNLPGPGTDTSSNSFVVQLVSAILYLLYLHVKFNIFFPPVWLQLIVLIGIVVWGWHLCFSTMSFQALLFFIYYYFFNIILYKLSFFFEVYEELYWDFDGDYIGSVGCFF